MIPAMLRGLTTIVIAAAIAAGGAATYAWGAARFLTSDESLERRPQVFRGLLPLCLMMAGLSAAGGIYVGLRISWARRDRRRKPASPVPLALGLLLLAPVLWIVTLTVPLCFAVGGLTAVSAAKLLGPASFPLTPRSWQD